ncbi:EPIDERMAL PATTERNING FACTOR-like protein 6 isoform X2 [Telopea speciosissima]|uniref:EPIDERMAL PATTERNING FACTOR-like protein 6 isoform X1 n=1 Tax=Telopea speciosissima TaxID=54955 RepID=UPI001CC5C247|nr:EPIDERMAL PATTERNING FACTOR-like protein 6 isoform X1 [Telopea speciosissima]XP_043724815.1 EPIDERMAL PATTERNING FACTOR-like protein 6 isoform X2 [Telopea speciosissima]
MDLKRSIQKFMSRKLLFYLASLCFFSVCALISTNASNPLCLDTIGTQLGRATKLNAQEFSSKIAMKDDEGKWGLSLMSFTRRYLRGVGSSPPRCTSKCGKCTPCKPVHVPVPPGTPVTTEYYPEAWRCKCGNKLYMP